MLYARKSEICNRNYSFNITRRLLYLRKWVDRVDIVVAGRSVSSGVSVCDSSIGTVNSVSCVMSLIEFPSG